VLALIGNVGTPTAIVALPIATDQKTLLFAALPGADVLRTTPPDRYVINFRASYAEETGAMVDALVESAGLKPEDIAFFTQRDGYGDAGFGAGMAALKRHGLSDEEAIVHVRYERNTLAVESAVASLILADRPPRAIVLVGTYRPCAKFIKLCRAANVKGLFLNVSFVGSNPLAEELGRTDIPVIVTQVVPHPLDTRQTIVRDYVADLHESDSSAKPGFSDLEGYIAARILLLAMAACKGEPTRETIVDALDGLGSFDLGLGQPLHLGPNDHQASSYVWPTILKDGQFVPFSWAELADLLKKEVAP
jgi:ABC-type branched-subunit amino acid transport system substrate-binding protein